MAPVENRQLELEQVIPDFVLPSASGEQVSPRTYKQRANLVIAFLDPNRYGGFMDLLREFAAKYRVYEDLETQIMVVSTGSVSDLQAKVGNLGLPFPVAADEDGEVWRTYLGSPIGQGPIGAIFVTDRYGALRTEIVAQTEGELPPDQKSVLDWLSLIEMDPDCGGGDSRFQR